MEENKSVIDTRAFPDIWKSLAPAQRGFLRYTIARRTTVTRQTIANWARGGRPVHKATRESVAKIIRETMGIRTSSELLFPEGR